MRGRKDPRPQLFYSINVESRIRPDHPLRPQSVLSAQWPLPGADAAAILTDFLRHLAAGQSNAAALRAAQLVRIATLRRERGAAHPFPLGVAAHHGELAMPVAIEMRIAMFGLRHMCGDSGEPGNSGLANRPAAIARGLQGQRPRPALHPIRRMFRRMERVGGSREHPEALIR
ncbi:MAG TPA: CHAT domain-containing protein [Pirellulales bacterium]|nr:CHAT domain-containing protein [Pirellulales bacterium]